MPSVLFVFKKTFEYGFNTENTTDEDKETWPFDYNEQLNVDWLEFWTINGGEIVNSSWFEKYSEHILQETDAEKYSNESSFDNLEKNNSCAEIQKENLIQENTLGECVQEELNENICKKEDLQIKILTDNSLEVITTKKCLEEEETSQDNISQNSISENNFHRREALDISQPICTDEVSNSCLWQELWNNHFTSVYQRGYRLYATDHYNHYTFYHPQSQEEYIEKESYSEEEKLGFVDQTEELLALGLPTKFGKSNNKYNRNRLPHSSSEPESDLESDWEEQNMAPSQQNQKTCNEQSSQKKKKKSRKLKKVPKIILEDKSLRNYWRKRFSLFSRFDEGIQLDRESWFSVTPEKVACHMAERLQCGTIIDAFCGSGGNSIQFARTCERVIAIDIDPEKIKNARHNANIYGVEHKIDFIIGDYLQLCESLKGDVVFLSPPWGGPKYISQKEYNIEESLVPLGATELAEKSRRISKNIAFFLPRNSNPKQIAKVAGIGNRVEVEHNYLDTKLIGLTAIYGDWLIDKHNLEHK